MTTWKKLNAKILAASTGAEILAALLRGEWHKTHGLEKNFPPALALTEPTLNAWLPDCPIETRIESERLLDEVLGVESVWSVPENEADGQMRALLAMPEASPGKPSFLRWSRRTIAEVQKSWTASRPRVKHPLAPLVREWLAKSGNTISRTKVTVTARGGMVRRPKRFSKLLHAPWEQASVDAARVDGEPIATPVPDVPIPNRKTRLHYRIGEQLEFPGVQGPPPLAPEWRLVTVGGLGRDGKSALPSDMLTLTAIAQALTGQMELADVDGAALLALTKDGEFRRPRKSDIRRWNEATLALRGTVFMDPDTHKWLPLAEVTALSQSTVIAPPEWMRGKRLLESGGWTLTADGGKASKARRIASADASIAGRLVTAMEYWLAAHWDGRKGIAASLRPAIGKSGPGPVMDLPWRELLRLSGFTWDPADPVADKAMQVRYRRAVERMRKAGYIVSAGPLAEAQAGDSVEIIGIQRATRARPAGLRIRASARFVEAANLSVQREGRGFETVPLIEWLGGNPKSGTAE